VTTVEASSSAVRGPRDAVADSMWIGIIGHVGNQNLGDESIIAAVIQNMRRRYPDAEINGFSLNAGATFSADALTECFTSLERDRGSVVDSLQAQVPDFKSAVQEQYDAVCLILSGEAGTGR